MEGWIKLHRCIESWEYADDAEMFRLWVHLLNKASHNGYEWHGIQLKPGQVIASREGLAKVAKTFTVQKVRTMLDKLKKRQQITIETTSRYTLITIVNWGFYQSGEEKPTSKSTSVLTSNQPATNQQLTTTNNVKNEKNERSSSSPQPPRGGTATSTADIVDDLVNYATGVSFIVDSQGYDPTIRTYLRRFLNWGATPAQIKFAVDIIRHASYGGKTSLDRLVWAMVSGDTRRLKQWEVDSWKALSAKGGI